MIVRWQCSEWCDAPGAASAAHEGYVADVSCESNGDGWFWEVRATAAVSEYPELIDCGIEDTAHAATFVAERVLFKAGHERKCGLESRNG